MLEFPQMREDWRRQLRVQITWMLAAKVLALALL